MNDQFKEELFGGKSFSDLLQDIYKNVQKKDKQINDMIVELKPLIKNSGDATVIIPMVKDFVEASVKNNEQLVKLAGIVQRVVQPTNNKIDTTEPMFSDEELAQLKQEYGNIVQPLDTSIADSIKSANSVSATGSQQPI